MAINTGNHFANSASAQSGIIPSYLSQKAR
jgi:hypothetical protein